MAQKCKHSGEEDGTLWSCPHFVPKANIGVNEASSCAACTQSRGIEYQIVLHHLLSHRQTAAVGGAAKSNMKGKGRASEDDARREAIAGFKKTAVSDNGGSSSKRRKGGKGRKQKRSNGREISISVRQLTVMPEGMDDMGKLNETAEPNLQRIDQLSKAGFPIFGSPGELEFSNQWSHRKLDEWLREMLPIAFEYMDEVAKDGGEVTWRLLKASRSRLSLHREVPDGYDFVDAKGGKSTGWQDSKLYLVSRKRLSDVIHELEGKGASTSKRSASDAELEDEPELAHRHYTRSKKQCTSKSYTATPIPNDNDDFQWSSDIENDQEIKSAGACIDLYD
ncbi:hypothetical protein JB92DRAFT_2833419 [Gautieria morchelliformis]|nr:hypothetical protein JB92DRAFT_2833419 [Gautieria morchelliformis]